MHPPSRARRQAGQTLVAVLDTIVDLNRQVIGATLQADQQLPSGSSFGGLRGGYARLTLLRGDAAGTSRSSRASSSSGTFPVRNGQLQTATIRISGAQAAPGTVRLGSASSASAARWRAGAST